MLQIYQLYQSQCIDSIERENQLCALEGTRLQKCSVRAIAQYIFITIFDDCQLKGILKIAFFLLFYCFISTLYNMLQEPKNQQIAQFFLASSFLMPDNGWLICGLIFYESIALSEQLGSLASQLGFYEIDQLFERTKCFDILAFKIK